MITLVLDRSSDQDGPLPTPRDERAGGFRDRNHHIRVDLSVH